MSNVVLIFLVLLLIGVVIHALVTSTPKYERKKKVCEKLKHSNDVLLNADAGQCPCGGVYYRVARCDWRTDYLNIHYDVCLECGFETYAHNGSEVKLERYNKWIESNKITA